MKLDDKTVVELAKQLGVNQNKEDVIKRVKRIQGEGDDQLINEILRVKEQLLGSDVPKEKQIEAVRNLMPLMNKEQKTRLIKLIELLES